VTNQNELVHAEVAVERRMHARFSRCRAGRACRYLPRLRGPTRIPRRGWPAAVSRDPDTALRVHTREEIGVDPKMLPSAVVAGGLVADRVPAGALVPLLPYLVGLATLA